MDVNDPMYGYTYRPRKSKRLRSSNRKLSISAQQVLPYSHPLEILIAAATFVELGESKLSAVDIKQAAKNWDKILQPPTLQSLENVAEQIADLVARFRSEHLYKPPGVAETIDWGRALATLGVDELDLETVSATLGAVVKYREDQERVRSGLPEMVRDIVEQAG